ncbi:hypothetical protein quinque_014175 [Culex quinquefasciatus]
MKDKVPTENHTNVIYAIPCNECRTLRWWTVPDGSVNVRITAAVQFDTADSKAGRWNRKRDGGSRAWRVGPVPAERCSRCYVKIIRQPMLTTGQRANPSGLSASNCSSLGIANSRTGACPTKDSLMSTSCLR